MKTSPAVELLIQAAKLLYGDRWSGALGSALNVDPRTLQRFANGQFPLPDDNTMLRELVPIIDQRIADLKHIRDRLAAPQRKAPATKARTRTAPLPTP